MMTAEFMLSKRSVFRITAALFSLKKLSLRFLSAGIYDIFHCAVKMNTGNDIAFVK